VVLRVGYHQGFLGEVENLRLLGELRYDLSAEEGMHEMEGFFEFEEVHLRQFDLLQFLRLGNHWQQGRLFFLGFFFLGLLLFGLPPSRS